MKLAVKFFSFGLILISCSSLLNAQVRQQIYPDRPYATKTPFVILVGNFEIETGFVYDKTKFQVQATDVTSENITLAQTVFRYGVANNFEFRFAGEFLINKTTSNGLETNLQGLRGLAVGTKIKFLNKTNELPDIALLINLNIPYGNENFRPDKFEPGLFFAVNKNFNSKIDFGISAGGENKSNLDDYFYSFGTFFNFAIVERLSAFVEIFGTSTKKSFPEQFAHFGITFLHLTNLKIDFSLGKKINGVGTEWFGNLGVAVLIMN